VDTSVFNKLLDGELSFSSLPAGAEFVATHIQVDELNNTKNLVRRSKLSAQFAAVAPAIEPTESMVWDVSRRDSGKWSDDAMVGAIKSELDALKGGKGNNWQDALIAEVAVKNGFGLITCDYHLAHVAQKHGASVTYFAA